MLTDEERLSLHNAFRLRSLSEADVRSEAGSDLRRVDEMAFEAGFNSLSAFYSCFRRHTGLSPKAYLKQISLRARTQDKG